MKIRFSKTARKVLLRSNKRLLIKQKIDELATDPAKLDSNVVKLVGQPESKLRVQDWSVIFRIEDSVLWIDQIGPRGSIYED